MPPTWRVRAGGLAEYIPTCKMVIGSCKTELVSLSDQKARLVIRKNNANFAKANAPADSIGYERPICGWRLGTMADLHPECRIFQGRDCNHGRGGPRGRFVFFENWSGGILPAVAGIFCSRMTGRAGCPRSIAAPHRFLHGFRVPLAA